MQININSISLDTFKVKKEIEELNNSIEKSNAIIKKLSTDLKGLKVRKIFNITLI